MRYGFCLMLVCFSLASLFGQNYKYDSKLEIIKVKQDSIANAIKSGPLSFLNDPNLDGWTELYSVNGLGLENYQKNDFSARRLLSNLKKGEVYGFKNIKMKKGDGKFFVIGSKKLVVE